MYVVATEPLFWHWAVSIEPASLLAPLQELRVIGENLKALEVAEEKAQQREEEYKKQIKLLTDRLKSAESRDGGAEWGGGMGKPGGGSVYSQGCNISDIF